MSHVATSHRAAGKTEAVVLGLVLVAAFHAIPYWTLSFLPNRLIFEWLGPSGYATFYDGLTLLMPLLLCLGAPMRSGLTLGVWRGHVTRVAVIMVIPIALTAIVYPFTSQPFRGDRIGCWLVSPAAQDLLFPGYIYGILSTAWPQTGRGRGHNLRPILLTALLFSIWHLPNFSGLAPTYVVFQLAYTFLGGAWMLLARVITGSVLPVIATHMLVNFIAWKGW